jgi:hypothetical protein
MLQQMQNEEKAYKLLDFDRNAARANFSLAGRLATW